MIATADVVIIGAGIVGSSIAWHLARESCRNVVLLERESRQGLGSTGKSMGGVRAQFATEPNIRMSLYSIPFLARFEEETGHPSLYRAHGYLFVASTAAHLEVLRANHRKQKSLGLTQARLVSPREIVEMVPQLRAGDILGGSFCPTDGFVDPHSVMTGFMEGAAARGAVLLRNMEVTGIQRDARGVAAVSTACGTIATRTLVNAAGAWASQVAALAGAELPIQPLRRMLVPTEPFSGLPERMPMVVEMATGFHFRREGRGLLLAWADPDEQPGYRTAFDPAFIEKILTRAVDRVPCFENLEVDPRRAWAGLYDMSPDHHAILGASPDVAGLFFANGFSGHGVMHSPATGRILADLILRGETGLVDARTLDVARFREGRAIIEETAIL